MALVSGYQNSRQDDTCISTSFGDERLEKLAVLTKHPTVTMEIPSCKKHFNSGAKISDKNVCTETPTPSLFVGHSRSSNMCAGQSHLLFQPQTLSLLLSDILSILGDS